VVEPLRVAVASHFEAVYVHYHPSIASFGHFYLEPRVRQELLDALRARREPDGTIIIDDLPQVTLGLNPENNLTGTGLRE
jgi:hypothetical protein